MYILFSNGCQIQIDTLNNCASLYIKKCFKHLQHIDYNFKKWDNPFDNSDCKVLLQKHANNLQINIPKSQDVLDQIFLNNLHKIYEKNYDTNGEWLDLNAQIHRCERLKRQKTEKFLIIDYRQIAGPLTQSFDFSWLKNSVTKVKAGDVFISWSELGKQPYDYWLDGEPDDIERLCELAKPWITLRPQLLIAIEDTDRLQNVKINEFTQWWSKKQDAWCAHWKIPQYDIKDQRSVILIGKIGDVGSVKSMLEKNITVKKVCLHPVQMQKLK